jgi:hypothetical protein
VGADEGLPLAEVVGLLPVDEQVEFARRERVVPEGFAVAEEGGRAETGSGAGDSDGPEAGEHFAPREFV